MSQPATTTETISDRIKLPLSYDVAKMQEEVTAMGLESFTYYKVIPLRAPAHVVDPSLPFPPPADDYADGTWTEWSNTEELKSSPYLMSILEEFQKHTRVTLVRMLRLQPGAEVQEHTDPTLGLHIERSVIRLTIPVFRDFDNIEFYLNGETIPMKEGECWYLRLTDPHKIINRSTNERINLTLDMEPNEWVRNLIIKAAD